MWRVCTGYKRADRILEVSGKQTFPDFNTHIHTWKIHSMFSLFLSLSHSHTYTLRLASVKMYDASDAHLPPRLHFKMRCSSRFLSIFTSVSTYCDQPACLTCRAIRVECCFFSRDIGVIFQNETTTFFPAWMILFSPQEWVCVCVWYNSAVLLHSFLVIWCLMYISVCTHLKHVLEILYFLCVVFRQQSIRAERENKRADKLICAGFQLKLQIKKLWFVV